MVVMEKCYSDDNLAFICKANEIEREVNEIFETLEPYLNRILYFII